MAIEYEKQLQVEETNIPGLVVVDLAIHGDSRGWFKENWQREKMTSLGLPDRYWVQNNISYNDKAGVTRGIHAEPWDKFISVAVGSVFGAWVDLRAGETFGCVFSCVLDPSKAIFVPRGVGNSYQALEDGTAYTYLVNAHWSAELKKAYTFVNLADPSLGIEWPIPLSECELSEDDKVHPMLSDVLPVAPCRTLVIGSNDQMKLAVQKLAHKHKTVDSFDFADSEKFDFSDPSTYGSIDWSLYDTVFNCSSYAAVASDEQPEDSVAVWRVNAEGPALLARACTEHGITLVHVSSDYIFEENNEPSTEDVSLNPRSVFGASKAAGDLAVSACPAYYILHVPYTSGEDKDSVKATAELSGGCDDQCDNFSEIAVADDQADCFSPADDTAETIFHFLQTGAPYGTYSRTGSGNLASWARIGRESIGLRKDNKSCT